MIALKLQLVSSHHASPVCEDRYLPQLREKWLASIHIQNEWICASRWVYDRYLSVWKNVLPMWSDSLQECCFRIINNIILSSYTTRASPSVRVRNNLLWSSLIFKTHCVLLKVNRNERRQWLEILHSRKDLSATSGIFSYLGSLLSCCRDLENITNTIGCCVNHATTLKHCRSDYWYEHERCQ